MKYYYKTPEEVADIRNPKKKKKEKNPLFNTITLMIFADILIIVAIGMALKHFGYIGNEIHPKDLKYQLFCASRTNCELRILNPTSTTSVFGGEKGNLHIQHARLELRKDVKSILVDMHLQAQTIQKEGSTQYSLSFEEEKGFIPTKLLIEFDRDSVEVHRSDLP